MVEIKNLVKKYGDHTAVDQLNLTVEKGQIYGFLGPHGAGKSTTMNIMTGCLAATQGTVTINGFDILEQPLQAKKCIGFLPEQPPVYMDLTPLEYLRFVCGIKGIRRADQNAQIDKVIAMTGIGEVKDRLIRHLSKGFRQRVGLAQAILGNPEVIILDEPTVGLDPKQIIEIRDLIKKLGEQHTVILSSHILSEVSAVCDKIMIMSHGRLVACDTPDNLAKMMVASNRYTLTVKGEPEPVRDALSAVVGVSTSEISPAEEPGLLDIRLESPKDKDIREGLFYALSAAKCPIFGLSVARMSLEDVFLELTSHPQEDKSPDAPAESKKAVDPGKLVKRKLAARPERKSAKNKSGGEKNA